MPDTIFRHGDPTYQDYTPSADVAAGQVVLVGDVPAIAHLPIPAGQRGALATAGGYYQATADAALVVGALAYWDDTANKATGTAGTSRALGWITKASTGATGEAALCEFYHQPATAA